MDTYSHVTDKMKNNTVDIFDKIAKICHQFKSCGGKLVANAYIL